MVRKLAIGGLGLAAILAVSVTAATMVGGEAEETTIQAEPPVPSELPAAIPPAPSPGHDAAPPETEPDGLTAEESAYRDALAQELQMMAGSIAFFLQLLQDPRMDDEDWVVDVAVELSSWRATYHGAQDIEPPERYRAAHEKYLEAMSELDQAALDFAVGFDDFDVERTEAGMQRLEQSGALMQEASALLS